MTNFTKLSPNTVAARLKEKSIMLIDIRESDEYAREHIAEAISYPLSSTGRAKVKIKANRHAVFHCKSGIRTEQNFAILTARIDGEAYIMDGGLDAWKVAGLPVKTDNAAPLEINRQVQVTAGIFVLVGVLLGLLVHPGFYGLPTFIGGGLLFAGLSGWCGMSKFMVAMPWNKSATE